MGGGLIWFNLESGRLSEEVMFKLRLEETHQSVAKWKKKAVFCRPSLVNLSHSDFPLHLTC